MTETISKGRAREVAAKGVRSLQDLANMQAGLMTDILTGEVSPAQANKLSAVVGKILKGSRRVLSARVS